MVTGLKGEQMDKTEVDVQNRAASLRTYALEMDNFYKSLGFAPAGDYLTNIFGQETLYGSNLSGYHKDNTYSLGLGQIDPIRYQELLDDYESSVVYKDRISRINTYMRNKEGYEDFDITKMATLEDGKYTKMSKYSDDPLANYMLGRLILLKDPNALPTDIGSQSISWDTGWNKNPDAGFPEEFLEKYDKFIKPTNMVNQTIDLANPLKNTLKK